MNVWTGSLSPDTTTPISTGLSFGILCLRITNNFIVLGFSYRQLVCSRNHSPQHGVYLFSASCFCGRLKWCAHLRWDRSFQDHGRYPLHVRERYTAVWMLLALTATPIASPKTKVANSSLWWGIDQTLTYGDSTPIYAESTAGIVDTGTSFLLLNPGTSFSSSNI